MEKLNIKSSFDDLKLSVLKMVPKGNAKGIVQISHGMAEHKERYIPFMEYLCNKGYIVVINDHRGHGESIRKKEDLGYFYDDSGEAIVEDLHQITMVIKSEYPKLPIYLFGHSMGSMVVRKYIKKYDKDIDKLIVCGSPSKNSMVGLAIILTNVIKKIKGDYYRSKFINNLALGNYNKKFGKVTSSNAWVCGNEEALKLYDEDELCGFIFTTNGFLNLFKLMRDTYDKKGYLLNNKDLPILFIAGRDDPVIKSQKAWIKAMEFLSSVGYDNIKGFLYNDMRHEILNEKENDKVFQDVINFISKHKV